MNHLRASAAPRSSKPASPSWRSSSRPPSWRSSRSPCSPASTARAAAPAARRPVPSRPASASRTKSGCAPCSSTPRRLHRRADGQPRRRRLHDLLQGQVDLGLHRRHAELPERLRAGRLPADLLQGRLEPGRHQDQAGDHRQPRRSIGRLLLDARLAGRPGQQPRPRRRRRASPSASPAPPPTPRSPTKRAARSSSTCRSATTASRSTVRAGSSNGEQLAIGNQDVTAGTLNVRTMDYDQAATVLATIGTYKPGSTTPATANLRPSRAYRVSATTVASRACSGPSRTSPRVAGPRGHAHQAVPLRGRVRRLHRRLRRVEPGPLRHRLLPELHGRGADRPGRHAAVTVRQPPLNIQVRSPASGTPLTNGIQLRATQETRRGAVADRNFTLITCPTAPPTAGSASRS